jgi:hypothetical protein
MNTITQIRISREEFNTVDDKKLARICIQPVIEIIKGKNPLIKSQIYIHLPTGQKSLLLFWILYGHSRHGIIQFFNEVDYLLKNEILWSEFKDRSDCFGNETLPVLINEIEGLYIIYAQNSNSTQPEILQSVMNLDKKYQKIIKESFKYIGKFIGIIPANL